MSNQKITVGLLVYFGVLIWSGIEPHERFVWFMEVLPGLLMLLLFAATYKWFQFTELTYWLILGHAVLLFIGAHFTYMYVPWFDALSEFFGWERNNFDKFAHIVQGFVPAIIIREFLIRQEIVVKKAWLPWIVISLALAFSALYEIIEWTTTFYASESTPQLLGMQGYLWDSQTDMLFAVIGAALAVIFLKRYHDKQISAMNY